MPVTDTAGALTRLQKLISTLEAGALQDRNQIADDFLEIVMMVSSPRTLSKFNALARELTRAMIRELDLDIRERLSQKVCTNPLAPQTIVKALASDVIEVARPVLASSTVLSDEDLVEIALALTPDHRVAITQRGEVSELVSASLIAYREPIVIAELLRNLSAKLSLQSFLVVGEVAQFERQIHAPLAMRPDAPEIILIQLVERATQEIQEKIYSSLEASPNATKKAILCALTLDRNQTPGASDIIAALGELIQTNSPIPIDILRCIFLSIPKTRGDLRRAALADTLSSPLAECARIIREELFDEFASLCAQIGMHQRDFEEIFEEIFPSARDNPMERSLKLLQSIEAFKKKTTTGVASRASQ
ncbi:MAG: DUF2336 domain-containing protein [Magnetospirillum sp.]|nr:DUF2336 domain-containing protein [Magnetospirillum sp.]